MKNEKQIKEGDLVEVKVGVLGDEKIFGVVYGVFRTHVGTAFAVHLSNGDKRMSPATQIKKRA